MYHHVEDNSRFKALGVGMFKKHLEYFSENFKPCTVEQLIKGSNENTVTITFDDGLNSQAKNAFHMLKKYNFPACFFLTTSNLVEKKINDAHKIWLLLSKFSPEELAAESGEKIEEKILLSPTQGFDDIFTANLKYKLRSDTKLLNLIFGRNFDEAEEHDKLYMDIEDIRMLLENGMEIGCHSHSHVFLSDKSFEEQNSEIRTNKDILKRLFNVDARYISYPFGKFNGDTLEIVKKLGFVAGFTASPDKSDNPLTLGRLDANHITELLKK